MIYLNAKCSGWRFAAYLSGLLYMVAAGITVQWIFAAFGALPTARPESLMAMMDIGIATHTFWLNVIFMPVAIALLVLRHQTLKQQEQDSDRPEARPAR